MTQTTQNPTPQSQALADERLRKQIKSRIVKQMLLKMHIMVYLVVNAFLFLLDTVIISDAYTWYPWSVAGWGLGLAIHIFAVTKKNAGLLSYHIFMYIIVNAFLVFINWFTTGTLTWVWWSLAGWGIAVFLHIGLYLVYNPSWINKQIDAEMKVQQQTPIPTPNVNEKLCPKCHGVCSNIADFCAICGQKL